ncbi:DUF6427 family protein [Aquimarina sp. W85]|uniref:DUF6427 family protein n=1 Tax=Aquimarina rhodophyticola TaxID=3342246 RepID=UPI00366F91B2
MLSTFLSKSKPINFIVISLYLVIMALLVSNKQIFEVSNSQILYFFSGIFLCLISLGLFHWILKKGSLTDKGTYALLMYVSLLGMVPEAIAHPDKIVASSLMLLSFSQMVDMMNHTKTKAKIFNASLCIGLASIIYFWSIGFIALLYLGIYFFRSSDYRNWFVPGIGLITIYVLANCFTLLFFDRFYMPVQNAVVSYDVFANTLNGAHFFTLGTLSICTIFFVIIYALHISNRPNVYKPLMKLVVGYVLIASIIITISPNKDTSELIFIIAPLAIMGATYLQLIGFKLIKEIHLWFFACLPFLFFLF